jgi:hypothetical protein
MLRPGEGRGIVAVTGGGLAVVMSFGLLGALAVWAPRHVLTAAPLLLVAGGAGALGALRPKRARIAGAALTLALVPLLIGGVGVLFIPSAIMLLLGGPRGSRQPRDKQTASVE